MSRTLIAFHAHPDDEALLTSGTMARAAAEGHRVVLVVATDGDLGLASSTYAADGHLGRRRLDELRASADRLGVARVEHLGYADSGLGPELLPDPCHHPYRTVRVPHRYGLAHTAAQLPAAGAAAANLLANGAAALRRRVHPARSHRRRRAGTTLPHGPRRQVAREHRPR